MDDLTTPREVLADSTRYNALSIFKALNISPNQYPEAPAIRLTLQSMTDYLLEVMGGPSTAARLEACRKTTELVRKRLHKIDLYADQFFAACGIPAYDRKAMTVAILCEQEINGLIDTSDRPGDIIPRSGFERDDVIEASVIANESAMLFQYDKADDGASHVTTALGKVFLSANSNEYTGPLMPESHFTANLLALEILEEMKENFDTRTPDQTTRFVKTMSVFAGFIDIDRTSIGKDIWNAISDVECLIDARKAAHPLRPGP